MLFRSVALHSTMYLFLRIFFVRQRIILYLYIPQCIYFYYNPCACTLLFRTFTFHNVSISTHQSMLLYVVVSFFTFHNVSISTVGGTGFSSIASNFTFHNVSISTRPIFSLSNTVITSPVLSTSFLISILSQIYTCDTYHTL